MVGPRQRQRNFGTVPGIARPGDGNQDVERAAGVGPTMCAARDRGRERALKPFGEPDNLLIEGTLLPLRLGPDHERIVAILWLAFDRHFRRFRPRAR